MRRLLCWLGWHEWLGTYTYSVHEKGRPVKHVACYECRHCLKTEER